MAVPKESAYTAANMEDLVWVDAQLGTGRKHPLIPHMAPRVKRVIEMCQQKFFGSWLAGLAVFEGDETRAKLIASMRFEIDEDYLERLEERLSDPEFVEDVVNQIAKAAADRKAKLDQKRNEERDQRAAEIEKAEKRGYQRALLVAAGLSRTIDPDELESDGITKGDSFELGLEIGASTALAMRSIVDEAEIGAIAACQMQRDTIAILAGRTQAPPSTKLLAAAIPAKLHYRLEEPVIARMLGFPTKWLSALPRLIEQISHLVGMDGAELRRRFEAGDPPTGWWEVADQTVIPQAA